MTGSALKRALLIAPLTGRDASEPHPVLTGRTHWPVAVNTHNSFPGSLGINLDAAAHSVYTKINAGLASGSRPARAHDQAEGTAGDRAL